MAWIRRVRTASGATAVQIVESVNGKRRIVRHIGSAHDETALGLLVEQAHQLLTDNAQGVLDLGISPPRRKAVLVPEPAPTLPATLTPRPSPQVMTGPRVLGTSSRLLYDTLAHVYTHLGFDTIDDGVFRDLVIARIAEPTSLLDIDRVLTELGRRCASYATRKRTLRRCSAGTYRDQIATACFAHARLARSRSPGKMWQILPSISVASGSKWALSSSTRSSNFLNDW